MVIQIIMGVRLLRGKGPVASSSNSKYLWFIYHIVSAVVLVNSDGFRLIYTCDCVRVVSESESALSFRMLNVFIVSYRTRMHSSRMRTARSLLYVRDESLSREGVLCPGGLCPGKLSWGSLSRRVSVQEGLCLGGLCPVEVSVQRGSLSRGVCLCLEVLCQGNPRTVTRVRYLSYWNAFFLSLNSVKTFRKISII